MKKRSRLAGLVLCACVVLRPALAAEVPRASADDTRQCGREHHTRAQD